MSMNFWHEGEVNDHYAWKEKKLEVSGKYSKNFSGYKWKKG